MLCLITKLIGKRFKNRDNGFEIFFCYDHIRILPQDGLGIESYGKTCLFKDTGIICTISELHTARAVPTISAEMENPLETSAVL